jgi:hypothetical protein
VIGERPADRLPVSLDEAEGAEGAYLRVEDLRPYAVAVHGCQPRHRVAVAGVTERLQVPVGERQLPPAAQVLIGLRLGGDGVVERLVQ